MTILRIKLGASSLTKPSRNGLAGYFNLMPSIFDYLDNQEFLKDYYRENKKQDKQFKEYVLKTNK